MLRLKLLQMSKIILMPIFKNFKLNVPAEYTLGIYQMVATLLFIDHPFNVTIYIHPVFEKHRPVHFILKKKKKENINRTYIY